MTTQIEIKGENIGRPAERPPKSNWKIEIIKKGLALLQHASPKKSADIIWHYFTLPGMVGYTEPQKEILKQAIVSQTNYKGDLIKSYKWGDSNSKVLLCHGWRSKSADFRRMINSFLSKGYQVEAIDMRAHGNSQGKHTGIPEFRDIIKTHIAKNGPYDTIIGHSAGGLAAGLAISELAKALHPNSFFIISAPPFIRYFLKDIIKDVGCNKSVYDEMCRLLKEKYHQPVDYFDLRLKTSELNGVNTHLIYCEDDSVVPFKKGEELEQAWSNSSFVHVKGLGHYKIIANDSIIEYIQNSMSTS